MSVLYADAQIVSLKAKLIELGQQREDLLTTRESIEDAYRAVANKSLNMKLNKVNAKIIEARKSPQTKKTLQSIHKAHKDVKSKENAIDQTRRDLEAIIEAEHELKRTMSALNVKQQQKEGKVQRSMSIHIHVRYTYVFTCCALVCRSPKRRQASTTKKNSL